MANSSETGYAKYVSNFVCLLTSINAFGAGYNPPKESIKRPALQLLLQSANEAFSAFNSALSNYSIAVDTKETAF